MPAASLYDPVVHLCVADIAVDSLLAPSIMNVTIKQSKTNPFRKGVSGNQSDWDLTVSSGSDA